VETSDLIQRNGSLKSWIEREIHFDLMELLDVKLDISEKGLEDLIDLLNFENILKYIQIPRYKLSTSSKENDDKPNWERSGCLKIFNHLRSKKGVKKIIRVTVDDDDMTTPHCDEALETLGDLDIEEWDWRRFDLCSDVISKAAPRVQTVFLYSNGNNAVLRGWSADDGLKDTLKFPNVGLCFPIPLDLTKRH
jgi:hypothetical protein